MKLTRGDLIERLATDSMISLAAKGRAHQSLGQLKGNWSVYSTDQLVEHAAKKGLITTTEESATAGTDRSRRSKRR